MVAAIARARLSLLLPHEVFASDLSLRKEIFHSNRTQLTILQAISVPLLSSLDVTMPKKITNLENCRTHVEQS